MSKLQQTANLFEVSFPDYKQLQQCRSDIILVKAVWDMVMFVKVIFTTQKIYSTQSSHNNQLTHIQKSNLKFVLIFPKFCPNILLWLASSWE